MKLQVLVSALNADPEALIDQMHLAHDAILVNQCDVEEDRVLETKSGTVRILNRTQRGVGKSRNLAFASADAEIVLFSDEDIEYQEGYAKKIVIEFEKNPRADIILFNVEVCENRKTYWNDGCRNVKWYNCGRYPAYSIAVRKSSVERVNVKYSELFGGGAKYSNGEDSLFLKQCLDNGLKVITSAVVIGKENERESTWFHGFSEKFFFDRGVLFAFLYGKAAILWAVRFVLTKRSMLKGEIGTKKAYRLIRQGIRQGFEEKKGE